MKQQVVMNVSMNGKNSQSKALKIAAGFPGVVSVAVRGDGKKLIVVTGDGIDSTALTRLMRKKIGFTELISVTPVGEYYELGTEETIMKQMVQPIVWSPYNGGTPHHYTASPYNGGSGTPRYYTTPSYYNGGIPNYYTTYEARDSNHDGCSIM